MLVHKKNVGFVKNGKPRKKAILLCQTVKNLNVLNIMKISLNFNRNALMDNLLTLVIKGDI